MRKTVKVIDMIEEAQATARLSENERAKGNTALADYLSNMVGGMINMISLAFDDEVLTPAWDKEFKELRDKIWNK